MNKYFLHGSQKYNKEITLLTDTLRNEGYSINSSINVPFKEITEPSQALITNKTYLEEEILNAQIILIYNKEDDIDLLTAMNLEYALAHKKSIELLFDPHMLELKSFCNSPYYDMNVNKTWIDYLNKEHFDKLTNRE